MDTSIFIQDLKLLGGSARALQDARYHKSVREHWGVPVPSCAELVKKYSKEMERGRLLSFARDLWDTNLFDPMMCSAKILTLSKIKPSKDLWQLILHCLQRVDGWALQDCLAHAAWKCILADASLLNELDEWSKLPNLWMRRGALVYTLPFAKKDRCPERMLGWASTYATDSEWFIQKAIGWWLRVLGEHNRERVVLFLNQHWDQLKTVARKEATRKLPSEWQKKVIGHGSRF